MNRPPQPPTSIHQSTPTRTCDIHCCTRPAQGNNGLCSHHSTMLGRFLAGWRAGSGKQVRLGERGNWRKLYSIFKRDLEEHETFVTVLGDIQAGRIQPNEDGRVDLDRLAVLY